MVKKASNQMKGIREGDRVTLVTEYATINGNIVRFYEEGVEVVDNMKYVLVPWNNVCRLESEFSWKKRRNTK